MQAAKVFPPPKCRYVSKAQHRAMVEAMSTNIVNHAV